MNVSIKRIISIICIILTLIFLSAPWVAVVGELSQDWSKKIGSIKSGLSFVSAYLEDAGIDGDDAEDGLKLILSDIKDGKLTAKEEKEVAGEICEWKEDAEDFLDLLSEFSLFDDADEDEIENLELKVDSFFFVLSFIKVLYVLLIITGIAALVCLIIFERPIATLVYGIIYAVFTFVNWILVNKVNTLGDTFEMSVCGGAWFGLLFVITGIVTGFMSKEIVPVLSGRGIKISRDTMESAKAGFANAAKKAQTAVQNAAQAVSQNAVQAEEIYWTCEACGARNRDENKFCGQCGTKRPELSEDAKRIVAKIQAEKDALASENETLNIKIASLEDEKQLLVQSLSEKEELLKNSADAASVIQKLQDENASLKSSSQNLVDQLAALSSDSETKIADLNAIILEKDNMLQGSMKTNEMLQQLQTENISLGARISELQSQLEAAGLSSSDAVRKIDELNKTIAEQKQALESKDSQIRIMADKQKAEEETPAYKFCRFCGSKIAADNKKCPQCGKEL